MVTFAFLWRSYLSVPFSHFFFGRNVYKERQRERESHWVETATVELHVVLFPIATSTLMRPSLIRDPLPPCYFWQADIIHMRKWTRPQLLYTVSDQKWAERKPGTRLTFQDKIWGWSGNETKSGSGLGMRQNLGVVWERVYVCTLLNKETMIGEIEPNEVLMVCGVR